MMSKINQTDIDRLIELVGGRGNIATVSHCITRLRFVLNQPANARPKEIEQLPMVKGCFTNAGQFQVVIGTNVGDYYQALIASTGQAQVDKEQVKKAARQNMKWHEQLISHFAEIFFPLLPALISGGLILGFRNVIGDLPMSNGQTLAQMYPSLQTIYDFLWLIGEAIFFYLPVGICWSAVKKMGGTPILGIVLGVTLVSPQLMNAYLLGQQLPEVWDFGMFSIAKVGYQAQVIPALLAGLALGVIETRLKRIVPDYLYLVVVPVCSLILAVFLAHALIGPFGRMIGDGVAFAVRHLMTGSFAPIGAALFGFLYAPLVITGVHQTTLAIDLQMIQSMGGTPVWPLIALSNIAQGSAVIGIIISSRKHNEREISVPAAISAWLGVTEPAMYGINLKYRFPMLCAMIGSGLAGLLCGLNGVMANGIGVGGLPGILSIQPSYWQVFALAMAIAIIIPIVLTSFIYQRKYRLGTLDDFDELVTQAKSRGIRIILDMVFNHTSTQHAWFREALNKESPYRQFYIWRDGEPETPPNNWRSKFGGSAWRWHAESEQYYLHLFAPEQADLNWENPAVRAELKKVCEFWADRGVDGLRLDVVNLISKDPRFPEDLDGDGRRFYTDGPRAHEFLHEMNRDVFTPRGLMTVGEMSSTSLEHCQRYAALTGSELSMTFNFHHLKVDYPGGEKWTLAKPDFVALKTLFRHWQQGMHNVAWNALFWCNHDQPRIVSRFGDEGEYRVPAAKMLAMVLHGMQGTPYIYQGEEIGMTNPHFTRITDYRDVESLNMFAELRNDGRDADELLAILASKSRDNSRTPMQWSNGDNAGFTAGEPWIGLGDNYQQINVEAALADDSSVFYTYQKLIALRKQEAILTWGNYQDLLPNSPVLWCYRREWKGQTLLVIANLSREIQPWQPGQMRGNWQLVMHNYEEASPQPCAMTLRPFEAVWWLQK
ncbi:PTS trehalose transporter subunit IIBC [Escherichia coli O145:NM]|nr:PTS trehalose transporter subunit IIBC [Escherichia coli]QCH95999.1 PTS trehalose transporter subunit IIBC [Escherichia coli O145:NM]